MRCTQPIDDVELSALLFFLSQFDGSIELELVHGTAFEALISELGWLKHALEGILRGGWTAALGLPFVLDVDLALRHSVLGHGAFVFI